MAIQFLRGTSEKAENNTHKSKVLSAGQPFIETDTKTLYIGDGEKTLAERSQLPHYLDSSAVLDYATYASSTKGYVRNAAWATQADIASSCDYWYYRSDSSTFSEGLYVVFLKNEVLSQIAICIAPILDATKDQSFPCLTFTQNGSFTADVVVTYTAETHSFTCPNDGGWCINTNVKSAPYRSFGIPLG